MEAGAERLAKTEVVFREVNERVNAIDETLNLDGSEDGNVTEFFCECGDADCVVRIRLTRDEYEHVRAGPTRFALALGHEDESIERIVARNDRFQLVEKVAVASEIAAATDPRS